MQSLLLSNKDRYGYYTVGNFKTYSKLEAIEYSGKTHDPVKWNFNCDTFEKVDCNQEPPGSLDFWYAARARQIREKYDYLVLWYSGGADSHNVLMSFVKNNIFIDEIAQFHNLAGEQGDKQSWINEEVFATSIPITQDLIQNNPVYRNTKHRLVDLSELEFDLLKIDDNRWDYFYKVTKFLSPNTLARSYKRELIPDYQVLMDQGKSVCFVHGSEKPKVENRNNQWYMVFSDCLDNVVTPRTQMLNREWEHDELFYWTDDLPQLVVKQAHVIKKFMNQLSPDMADNVHVFSNRHTKTLPDISYSNITIDSIEYRLLPDGLHRLIYPDWMPNAIVCGKTPSAAYSNRDTWMFQSAAPDLGQRYYNYGLLHLRQLVKRANPDYWFEFKFDPKSGVPYDGGMKPLKNQYCIA